MIVAEARTSQGKRLSNYVKCDQARFNRCGQTRRF